MKETALTNLREVNEDLLELINLSDDVDLLKKVNDYLKGLIHGTVYFLIEIWVHS